MTLIKNLLEKVINLSASLFLTISPLALIVCLSLLSIQEKATGKEKASIMAESGQKVICNLVPNNNSHSSDSYYECLPYYIVAK